MGNEQLAAGLDEAEETRQFEETGRAILESYGAEHLADRELSIVHGDRIITGTIAAALGGRCPEFTTFAQSMYEVGGTDILVASIDKYVEKSELKKKS